MEPRIYTYKITFPSQGWWYWGVHKESKYGEDYNGSPKTHKAKWDNFYYEKQILEFFETWEEAGEVEKRLIKPDLNNPMCLNEYAGGVMSFSVLSEAGKKGGKKAGGKGSDKAFKAGTGIYAKESKEKSHATCRKKQIGIYDPKVQAKAASAGAKSINAKKFKCLVTGHISTSGPLTKYQRKRGIDPLMREQL